MFQRDFTADLANLDWFSKEPFALVRFADGERAILEGREIPTADGWSLPPVEFRVALRDAREGVDRLDRYFAGISCPCCDEEGHDSFLASIINHDRLTFSNIFANGNWATFLRKCKDSPPRSVGWVGPYPVENLPKFLYPVAWVATNLVNDPLWSRKIDRIVDKMHYESASSPIFVAAGPAAKIIIHTYWRRNPLQTVIDIGSALDPYIFGHPTRGYHQNGHPNQKKVCVWSREPAAR